MGKVVVVLGGNEGVTGTVHFTQQGDGPTTITQRIFGLTPGPHFNPFGKDHEPPEDDSHHTSYLGNVKAGDVGPTVVIGRIFGFMLGLHRFHVHSLGGTTNGYNSTGPHFNSFGKKDQEPPEDENRHTGDLGNVKAGDVGEY